MKNSFLFAFHSNTSYLIVECLASDMLAGFDDTLQRITKVILYQSFECQQKHESLKAHALQFFHRGKNLYRSLCLGFTLR